MNPKEIGDRLRAQRERPPRTTLAALSAETGCLTVARISNYEQGIRLLKANEAQILADAFTRLNKPITAAKILGIDKKYTSEKQQEGAGELSRDEEVLVMKYRQMSSSARTHYQEIGVALTPKKVTKKHDRRRK